MSATLPALATPTVGSAATRPTKMNHPYGDGCAAQGVARESEFLPLGLPGYCARLLQVSTPSQKFDMSWKERGRSVVSGSLILIGDYMPSMAPPHAEVSAGPGGAAAPSERLTGLHLAR